MTNRQLYLSTKRHKELSDQYFKKLRYEAKNLPIQDKNWSMWMYHGVVASHQQKKKRILTESEKKEIFHWFQ